MDEIMCEVWDEDALQVAWLSWNMVLRVRPKEGEIDDVEKIHYNDGFSRVNILNIKYGATVNKVYSWENVPDINLLDPRVVWWNEEEICIQGEK